MATSATKFSHGYEGTKSPPRKKVRKKAPPPAPEPTVRERREHEGKTRQPLPSSESTKAIREHEGRVKQPGVPRGPRNSTSPKGRAKLERQRVKRSLGRLPNAISEEVAAEHGRAPSEDLRRFDPAGYNRALRKFGDYHASTDGLKEDPIAEAVIGTVATAGIGAGAKLAATGVKAGVESLAARGADDVAETAVRGASKSVARSAKETVPKRLVRRIKEAPERSKAKAAQKVEDTKLRYSKTGRQVARRNRAVKLGAYGPALTATGSGVGALGVLGADIEGTIQANPLKAIPRTLEIAPGLVVSTADLGAQAIHALATGDTEGLRKRLGEELKYNKKLLDTFTAGDPEKVKAFTEDQGYVVPLMAAGPLAKAGSLGRDAAAARRGAEIDTSLNPTRDRSAESAPVRSFRRSRGRKRTSRNASLERSFAQHEVTDAAKPITKAYLRTKGRRKLRNKPVDVGDVVALAAEEGLTPESAARTWPKVAAKWEGRPETPHKREGGVTGHDLMRFVAERPGIFGDKHFWEAVDAYRTQSHDVTTSDRVLDIEQAKTHGVQQREQRVPPAARDHLKGEPEVRTRQQAEHFVGKHGPSQKRAKRLARTLRAARADARARRAELNQIEKAERARQRRAGKKRLDPTQLVQRKSHELLDVEADIRAMETELGATRQRRKKIARALRDPRQDALAAREFHDEMEAVRGDHGLVRGVYVPHTDVATEGIGVEHNVVSPSKAQHERSIDGTSLAEQGRVDYSLPRLLQAGVAAPRITKGVHRFVSRELHEGAFRIPVRDRDGRAREKRIVTREEAEAGLSPQEKKHVVLFDVGKFNQAVRERDVDGIEEAVSGLGQEIDWRKEDKGKKYAVLDKDHGAEIMAQVSAPGKGLQAVQTASRGISRAILASPAWAAAQIVAEGLQAAHVVNPLNPATYVHAYKGFKGYRDMTEAEKRRVRAEVGETAIGYDKSFFTVKGETQKGLVERFNRVERVLPIKYALQAVKLDWLNAIDRYKGGKIQLGATLIEAHREAYGLGKRLERTLKGEREISERLAKMSEKERVQWALRDTPDKRSITSAIKDQLGDWRSLSRREKVAAPALIFYPFLRMSLQWPFYALPKHHPLRAAVMYDVAASHNEQLRHLLGGDPAWFGEYATGIVYGKEFDGGALKIKGSRIVPGANALLEALSVGGDPSQVLNPVVSFYGALINGVDPLTGEPIDTAGMSAEEKWIARAGLTTSALLSINPEIRALDALKGSREATSLPIVGPRREHSALGELIEKVGESPTEKAVTSIANPFPAEDFEHAKDRAIISRILEVWKQYGSDAQDAVKYDKSLTVRERKKRLAYMEARSEEADSELHRLEHKYEVPFKAEERRGKKEFEALTYPPTEKERLYNQLGIKAPPTKAELYESLGLEPPPSKEDLQKELGLR